MKESNFLVTEQAWSTRKFRLLVEYLYSFSMDRNRRMESVFVVDAFPATNVDLESLGSPAQIARLAAACARWPSPVALRIINLHSKRDQCSRLNEALLPWVEQGLVQNMWGRLERLTIELSQAIREAPALFFIAPYERSLVPFSGLEPFLKREPLTELIINLDTQRLKRAIASLDARLRVDEHSKESGDLLANIARLIGRVKQCDLVTDSSLSFNRRVELIVSAYTKKLAEGGYKAAAYRIRTASKSACCAHMIYRGRDARALKSMNSWIRFAEDRLIRSHPLTTGIVAKRKGFSIRRRELRRIVMNYAQERGKCTLRQIRSHVMLTRFGDFHEDDFKAVLKEMESERVLQPRPGTKAVNQQETLVYYLRKQEDYCVSPTSASTSSTAGRRAPSSRMA